MTRRCLVRRYVSVAGLAALALSSAAALPAAAGQQPSAALSQPDPRTPDFLFGRPKGSVGLCGSWTFASAGSDLYDFVARELTIDRHDFDSPGIGFTAAMALGPRLDAQAGVEWHKTTIGSEYRNFVDNNFLPIAQSTSLRTLALTGSVRYALAPRGRDVSRFAWVPSRLVPYVGAGAGAIFYEFEQIGDFVDFVDLSVFPDVFRSNGWAPSAHVLGGVDIRLYRGLYGTLEGRYTRASAALDRDFIDFDPIDLSGLRLAAGVNLLF